MRMKRLLIIVVSMAALLLAGCAPTSRTTGATTETLRGSAPTNVHEATLAIDGMTCTSCALGVEYQLKHVEGVIDAKVSYEDGTAYVRYDADKVDAETIAKASDVYPASVLDDSS
ncbi:heavy-metal-associated domain-containing protein [Candidatus Woesearchaeota archaeon]|nr:MAG: heavy-metal-associated domain-containing protein [Candidatus Woesearchaeota archaeon]